MRAHALDGLGETLQRAGLAVYQRLGRADTDRLGERKERQGKKQQRACRLIADGEIDAAKQGQGRNENRVDTQDDPDRAVREKRVADGQSRHRRVRGQEGQRVLRAAQALAFSASLGTACCTARQASSSPSTVPMSRAIAATSMIVCTPNVDSRHGRSPIVVPG